MSRLTSACDTVRTREAMSGGATLPPPAPRLSGSTLNRA